MEKKNVFQKVQDILSSNPVIVLGSGASVPYGIPSMQVLADELLSFWSANLYNDANADKAVSELITELEAGKGLEAALLDVKVPSVVEKDIVNIVWKTIQKADLIAYNKFVQGEYVNLRQLFDYIIYNDPNKVLNVVSTNYDRIAEYAVCQTDAYLNIGFTNGLMGRIKDDIIHTIQIGKDYTGQINVLKVHGSLDWYKKDDMIYNIPNSNHIPQGLVPCIVTPGISKYERTQQEPHRQLLSAVDQIFQKASYDVCIGYGFNDRHVQTMLLKYAKKRKAKILIVTKDITDSIRKNVIDKEGYDYLIIYSDGSNGTIFQDNTDKLVINDAIYWTIDGLMNIIN